MPPSPASSAKPYCMLLSCLTSGVLLFLVFFFFYYFFAIFLAAFPQGRTSIAVSWNALHLVAVLLVHGIQQGGHSWSQGWSSMLSPEQPRIELSLLQHTGPLQQETLSC